MTSALYGRMKLGRCLSRDYYVGCSADVLPQLDERCSGKRTCHLEIPDTDLHNLQPCPKDLLAYLQASYKCIKGRIFTFLNLAPINAVLFPFEFFNGPVSYFDFW